MLYNRHHTVTNYNTMVSVINWSQLFLMLCSVIWYLHTHTRTHTHTHTCHPCCTFYSTALIILAKSQSGARPHFLLWHHEKLRKTVWLQDYINYVVIIVGILRAERHKTWCQHNREKFTGCFSYIQPTWSPELTCFEFTWQVAQGSWNEHYG